MTDDDKTYIFILDVASIETKPPLCCKEIGRRQTVKVGVRVGSGLARAKEDGGP
jgi:hypothetical protein